MEQGISSSHRTSSKASAFCNSKPIIQQPVSYKSQFQKKVDATEMSSTHYTVENTFLRANFSHLLHNC